MRYTKMQNKMNMKDEMHRYVSKISHINLFVRECMDYFIWQVVFVIACHILNCIDYNCFVVMRKYIMLKMGAMAK